MHVARKISGHRGYDSKQSYETEQRIERQRYQNLKDLLFLSKVFIPLYLRNTELLNWMPHSQTGCDIS